MKKRGFEKISFEQFSKDFEDKIDNLKEVYESFPLPVRKTKGSAGYDIHSLFDFYLLPGESKIVPTGLKVYMSNGEFLSIVNRSSLGIKYGIMLKNQIGIIDQDYYNNIDNEGHFMIGLINMGQNVWHCTKGDAIAQGIFINYLVIDDEAPNNIVRLGGIGSTNRS